MDRIVSNLGAGSADFTENQRKTKEGISMLRQRLAVAREGGSAEARRRHTERGKLLVRERIDRLIDPGTPFLELSPLAAYDMYDNDAPASGLVTGVCRIPGREAVGSANARQAQGGRRHG